MKSRIFFLLGFATALCSCTNPEPNSLSSNNKNLSLVFQLYDIDSVYYEIYTDNQDVILFDGENRNVSFIPDSSWELRNCLYQVLNQNESICKCANSYFLYKNDSKFKEVIKIDSLNYQFSHDKSKVQGLFYSEALERMNKIKLSEKTISSEVFIEEIDTMEEIY